MDDTKHEIVANLLIREIADGKFEPLGEFPSDRALMRRFGVSRQTVRLAMRKLEEAGLLYRRRGKGTFLSKGAGKLTRGIGVIVSGGRYSEIFPTICDEIRDLADKTRFQVLVGDASYRNADVCAKRTLDMVRALIASKVCGVIYQPVQFAGNSERINGEAVGLLKKAGIPVVLIDCDIVPSPGRSDCDVVGINNFDAGRRVAAHLLDAGARHIRFLASPGCAMTVKSRMYGVSSMMPEDNGRLLLEIDPTSRRDVERALAADPGVDAVVCQNDIAAASLIATLRKLGRSIPDDIMVAGFDDVAFARIQKPSLTSVRQPCRDIARTAYDRLTERMATPNLPTTTFDLSAPLVIRDSTTRLPSTQIRQGVSS